MKMVPVYLALVLMSLYVVNNSVFLHTHKTLSGTYITHAHPFDKAHDSEPVKHHQHSKQELTIIASLEIFLFATIAYFAFVVAVHTFKYVTRQVRVPELLCSSVRNGRAPPLA